MKIIRDIAFSRSEPPKSFIWIGFTDDGKYFIRVWSNGWNDISSNITVKQGNGLVVTNDGETYTIGLEQGLYESIQEFVSKVKDWTIGTAEDVDEAYENFFK